MESDRDKSLIFYEKDLIISIFWTFRGSIMNRVLNLMLLACIILSSCCLSIDKLRETLNYYEADELDTRIGKLEIRLKGYKMKSGYFVGEWVKIQYYAIYREPDPAKAMCIVFASSICTSGSDQYEKMVKKVKKQIKDGHGPYPWHLLEYNKPVILSPMYNLAHWGTEYDCRIGADRAVLHSMSGHVRYFKLKSPDYIEGQPQCKWCKENNLPNKL